MALAGLVLHSSRCGSTLVLRALACWPGVVGVDEPPELDEALTAVRRGGDESELRTVLAALGNRAERVVVKTDAWHVLEQPRLVAAADDVPWLFVHRDPVETLVSHARAPGSHTVPGLLDPVWFGPPRTVHPLPHAADVLARIFAAAADVATTASLLDHADLSPERLATTAARFGLAPEEVDQDRLTEVFARHAKHPHLSYVDDRADKRARTTREIAALASERVRPAYARLLDRVAA